MSVADRVRELVLPLLDDRDLDLYDVEMQGPVLRVVVDSPQGSGGGLDLNVLVDEADPITGRYTLEVTSPGLERTLRRPEHFERAVGETVKIRTLAGVSDERRVEGQLVSADDSGVVVRTGAADDGTAVEQRLGYHDIERARTVFEWGPATPRSGKRKSDEKRERR